MQSVCWIPHVGTNKQHQVQAALRDTNVVKNTEYVALGSPLGRAGLP